jgi:hypothetical protein
MMYTSSRSEADSTRRKGELVALSRADVRWTGRIKFTKFSHYDFYEYKEVKTPLLFSKNSPLGYSPKPPNASWPGYYHTTQSATHSDATEE